MNSTHTTNQADVLTGDASPGFYLRVILRRKWTIFVVFLAVASATTLYTVRQPKVFGGTISLIIDSKEPRFLDEHIQDVNSDATGNYWASKEALGTQMKTIQSRKVSQRVVEKLALASEPDFLGVSKILDEKRRAEAVAELDPLQILQKKIKIEPDKDSRVLYIKVEDSDPNRAAMLANETAQAFMDEVMAQKLNLTENASKWLDQRRDSLSESSKATELALYDFRRQSDMLSTSIDDRSTMVSARLTSTSAALTDVQLKIAGLKGRVAAIRDVQAHQGADDRLWAEALPAARENLQLAKNKERVLTLKNECVDLASRYLEGHPKLIECRDRLASAEREFARELSNLVLSSQAELKEAVEKERNLVQLLKEAKAEAFEVEKKKVELDRLKSESENTKRQYDSVFKRLKDVELSGLLRTSNIRVLDAARPIKEPISPNIPQGVLIGVIAGLVLGMALALLLEFLDASITSRQEIEERLHLNFLGFIPTIPKSVAETRDLHIFREPKSVIAECTRSVRTNLLFTSPDKPFRRMLVTSSGPQEGKSTTVINLGIAMAQSGSRVLIVDTDMRRPRLHKAFGVSAEVGVSSLVVGEGKLEDALKATEVPGLFLLPCGPVPPNPAELLHTKAFASLLDQLGTKFDRLILDSPPVGAVSDAVVLSTQVDGVVIVLKAGATNREMALRTVKSLSGVKANLYGAVLNNVNLEKSKYGDDYYGYAHRYYGYGEKNA